MDKKSDRIALFISVLLHSLLVFLPRQEEPLPLAESSPPTDSIPVVELPPLPASEFQPLPAIPSNPPAPTAPSSPPAPVVLPSPPVATPADPLSDLPSDDSIPETNDPPIEKSAPEPDPDADLSLEDPTPEPSDSPIEETETKTAPDANLPPEDPIPETSDSSINETKITADWDHLVGYLEDQDAGFGFTLFEIFDFFGETGQTNQFFDENHQPKLDVSSFSHFPAQTPEQVQTKVIPELTNNTDFALQLQENVTAGQVYQLLHGEMLRYLIIVRLRDGEGSVLMLSDSLQGLES